MNNSCDISTRAASRNAVKTLYAAFNRMIAEAPISIAATIEEHYANHPSPSVADYTKAHAIYMAGKNTMLKNMKSVIDQCPDAAVAASMMDKITDHWDAESNKFWRAVNRHLANRRAVIMRANEAALRAEEDDVEHLVFAVDPEDPPIVGGLPRSVGHVPTHDGAFREKCAHSACVHFNDDIDWTARQDDNDIIHDPTSDDAIVCELPAPTVPIDDDVPAASSGRVSPAVEKELRSAFGLDAADSDMYRAVRLAADVGAIFRAAKTLVDGRARAYFSHSVYQKIAEYNCAK